VDRKAAYFQFGAVFEAVEMRVEIFEGGIGTG
jgi:hypothetical protein